MVWRKYSKKNYHVYPVADKLLSRKMAATWAKHKVQHLLLGIDTEILV